MLVLALIFLLSALLFFWRWTKNENEPPALAGALPLIGHAHLLIRNSIQLWDLLKESSYETLKAGGVQSLFLGPTTVYASVWKQHRKLLNPAFSQVIVDGFLDVFNSQSRRLVKDLEKETGNGPFDQYIYARYNTLETICLTALGIDIRDKSVLNSEYVSAAEQMFAILVDRFQKFWLHSSFLFSWSSLKKKHDQCMNILCNMSNNVLNTRKSIYLKYRQSKVVEDIAKGPKMKPFMDLLLELSTEKGVITDQQVREHVDTIIVGGHDTSATVITLAMILVGSHPQVQEKIFQELHSVFGDEDRDVTKYDLSQLEYLDAVLKETLRVYPVVPITARYLDKDVKIRNYTLKSGRTCFLFIQGIHRHPMWGSDAEQFVPERWLDPSKLPKCPTAFAAFSVGRRVCIGKTYAFSLLKTTLAHIFRNYRVSGDCTKLVLKIDVMLKPESGYFVSIEKRNN